MEESERNGKRINHFGRKIAKGEYIEDTTEKKE